LEKGDIQGQYLSNALPSLIRVEVLQVTHPFSLSSQDKKSLEKITLESCQKNLVPEIRFIISSHLNRHGLTSGKAQYSHLTKGTSFQQRTHVSSVFLDLSILG